MTELFVEISNRLQQQVPQLKWIDEDTGQLDNFEGERPSVAFPCALIDVQFPSCDDFAQRYQQCTANIRVRVAFDTTGERTSTKTPQQARELSLHKYAVTDAVYRALQGFETESFSPLTRKSVLSAMVRGYKTRDFTFETTFADETAM